MLQPSEPSGAASILIKLDESLSTKSGCVWKFLEVPDILNLSVCSRRCASMVLSESIMNNLISTDKRVSSVGHFKLSFSTPMTFGIFRRTLCRLVMEREASVSIGSNGRINLDIGSAFNDRNTYLATASPIENDEQVENIIDHKIEKYLEISSYDEYDDFTPTHPLPKDKTHRRGNSYFNSDIEVHANQALSTLKIDIQDVASIAMGLEASSITGLVEKIPKLGDNETLFYKVKSKRNQFA